MTTSTEVRVASTDTAPATVPPALEVEHVSVTFPTKSREIAAVRDVSFRIGAGKTLVLLGESGSGKSVTSRAIMRLYGRNARISGTVRMGDTDLFALDERSMRKLRGAALAMVPQDPTAALDPLRRVGGQLVEVLRTHGMAQSRADAKARCRALLASVGIPDPDRVARSYPHELSGGMRQRAMIAVAIACEPRVLVADEPTTALDVTVQAQVLELFAELQRRLGMAMLMVTHDVGVARDIADEVAVMYAGRIVEAGPADEVLTSPRHPYTMGLLGAVPTPTVSRGALLAIPGRPPAAGEPLPAGCAFSPRCPHVEAACRAEVPSLVPVGVGRTSACPVVNGGWDHATEEERAS
jgi:oligopeptide/dipeptide ABC transporter ATP-binding protein